MIERPDLLEDIANSIITFSLREGMKMPLNLKQMFMKTFKAYELYSLRELIENYEKLSKPVHIPNSLANLLYPPVEINYTRDTRQEYLELCSLTAEGDSPLSMKVNPNLLFMPHIYLRNPRKLGKHIYKAWMFDAVDINNVSIPAAIVIKPSSQEETLLHSLTKRIVNSSPLTSYWIFGLALTQDYYFSLPNGIVIKRDKLLKILDININRSDTADSDRQYPVADLVKV